MDFKKKMKKFFTMTRKADGGFTLVELIVVIAILAILGGVGVPAYSGYVKKANMGADLALVSEIEHALVMAYYANPSEFNGGAIVGVSHGANAVAYDNFANKAMVAAFGEGWEQTVQLKYDGWKSENVEVSNFKGSETYLLGKVDYLTTNLMEPLNAFAGDNFKNFMNANGIDTTDKKTVSNAAVLYVANNTANLSKDQQNKLVSVVNGATTSGGVDKVLNNINNEVFGGKDLVSSAATMYALAEAFAKYAGDTVELVFNDTETPDSAAAKINNEFKRLARDNSTKVQEYFNSKQAEQDVKAYMDIMSTVNSAKGQVVGNLSSLGTAGGPTWASSYTDLFVSYGNGGVFVFLEIDGNKTPISGSTLVKE